MNPEAGLLQSPFRLAVERVAKSHPLMKWPEVHRLAQSQVGQVEPEPEPTAEVTPTHTPGQQELSLS